MNDYKITLNKRQESFLSKLLPKGYSFQPYKVRNNLDNNPYKEFDKKYKKTDSVILSKKESLMFDSLQPSQKSFRQKSQVPSILKETLSPFQIDLLWLVMKFRRHQSSSPFRAPVDPKALQIPDYFNVVLEPIDLKMIEEQIRADQYHHMSEFKRDIYKMMMNSYKFNQKLTNTYIRTVQFEQFFTQTMKQWQKLKEEGQGQLNDKDEVKEEMAEDNATETMRNEETERKLEGFNLWNLKEKTLSGLKENSLPGLKEKNLPGLKEKNLPGLKERNLPGLKESNLPGLKEMNSSGLKGINLGVRVQNIPVREPPVISQEKEARDPKIYSEAMRQRVRIQKKVPKVQQIAKQLHRIQTRQLEPVFQTVKRQQPQSFMQQEYYLPCPQQPPIVVLSIEPKKQQQQLLVKNQKQEKISDELREDLDNETVKQNNFSQGYNDLNTGNKIRNTEVQKEITSLLKKLNEYPLTKHKNPKILSNFTNLQQNMTITDKKRLAQKIHKLNQNDIYYVIRILTRGKQQILKQDEFQIDLDKADSKILREIQNFIAIRDDGIPNYENKVGLARVSQSMEMIKVPKKVKKEEKKILKKKISRKNSNNDQSFSINPPQIKKRKSQKQLKKNQKANQYSSMNVEPDSENDSNSSPSSCNQEAQIRVQKITGQQNPNQIIRDNAIQASLQQKQRQNSQQKKVRQAARHDSNRYEQAQIFINPNPQLCHSSAYHYEANHYDDIDQFLVSSSKHFSNCPESSPQYGPLNSGRKKKHSIEQLDYICDPNFQFGKSALKDYGDEQINQYSMNQHENQPQQEHDQFM